MSKAAKRAKTKRRAYSKRLASENLVRFEFEWEKRLSSWVFDIKKYAGKLRDHKGNQRPSVFAILDEALMILEACGPETYKKYAEMTNDTLGSQCIVSFSDCIVSFSDKATRNYNRISNYKLLEERCRLHGFKEIKRKCYYVRP